MAVAFTVILVAFLIYWLPQIGAPLPTDVIWIYRLQVAPAEEIGQVPAGLDLFTGAPMGWIDACVAHYEAYKRLNCGDIVLWRLFAIIAGSSGPAWLALTLVGNIAMVVLVDQSLRRLDAGWLLRVIAAAGLMLLPIQTWMVPATSEPRLSLAIAAAVAAALSGRHLIAAVAMALAVAFKEPSIVWWPFIAALSLIAPDRNGRIEGTVARLAPHAIVGLVILLAGGAIWFIAEARNNYPFLVTTPRPDILPYIGRALAGMAPAVMGVHILWSLPLAVLVLVAGVWRKGGGARLVTTVRAPAWWLPLLAGVLGIAGHVAVHWLTRREIGDSRYLVPGNIVAIVLIGIALQPLLLRTGRGFAAVAGAIAVAAVFSHLWSPYPEMHALAPLVAIPAAILGLVAVLIAGGRRWQIATGLFTGFTLGWLSTATIDYRLRIAAEEVVDRRSWNQAVNDFVQLPQNVWVLLRTSDPLMIETVWSLQAELLFTGRKDVTLWVEPADTSFYSQESGLVKSAHEAFNASAMTRERAEQAARPVMVSEMARTGRQRSKPGPTHSPFEWLFLAIDDPAGFMRQRYFQGKMGYLVWRFRSEEDGG